MADFLEIIKEEQNNPTFSPSEIIERLKILEEVDQNKNCSCKKKSSNLRDDSNKNEKLLRPGEQELKHELEIQFEKDISILKEKFDFILQNEQVRASYMLREAHRERQEKISALQTQLECKNLAGLIYVMCIERRKSKLEKLRLIEEYTKYINALQDILTEAQDLILNLSRGYKTASRVDQEWRAKITKIMKEFQAYVYHFCGGTPEVNQYFFDLPELLKTKTPVVDDPNEDPCEVDEEIVEKVSVKNDSNSWWERMEDDCPPFVMFGDMAEFKPPQRRQVLKTVKAAKTAPKKWKEYVFNEMFLKSECPNSDSIKDKYSKRLPVESKGDCQIPHKQQHVPSKMSLVNGRAMGQSLDIRGNMGSLLKIITTHAMNQPVTNATLLGARDSMEIASTTKLREKHKSSGHNEEVINVGNRRVSLLDQLNYNFDANVSFDEGNIDNTKSDDEDIDESLSALGSVHNDSLQIIPGHVPDKDHKINYEKLGKITVLCLMVSTAQSKNNSDHRETCYPPPVAAVMPDWICPMEECQRLQVDSFMKTLPRYMRANPFCYFEKTFDQYETCSPEQIEILKQRIEEKRKKEKIDLEVPEESPLKEWTPNVEGVATQTSTVSMSLPPCTCTAPSPTPISSVCGVFRVDDLVPIKMALDRVNKECLHDDRIDFNRFKLVGMERVNSNIPAEPKANFKQTRFQEITKILKLHPSLLDIFQANTRC